MLSSHQEEIVAECLQKGGGGLQLPMGSGKTRVSLEVGLRCTRPEERILIVMAKNLLTNWMDEFKLVCSAPYEILHQEFIKKIDLWAPHPETKIILTTPEILSKYFKQYEIRDRSIVAERVGRNTVNHYMEPIQPFLNEELGGGILFSLRWGCLIVDEIQTYTSIDTLKCQALAALCARVRWGLSGTLFPEPTPERIFGYHLILNLPGPRDLPEMKRHLKSPNFLGLDLTTVKRETNPDFVPPEIHEEVVSHALSEEEAKIYLAMKGIMNQLRRKVEELRVIRAHDERRRFSAYLLAMLTYFRQGLICPIIPIASAAVDIVNHPGRSELSKRLLDTTNRLGLTEWLNDLRSICSTRIQHILRKIEEHKHERMLVFSCYRSCLDLLKCYLGNYNVFSLEANMKVSKRKEVMDAFSASPNGILLLTYSLGSNGLNLQAASTVILTDLAWNRDTSKQSVARMLRFGQMAKNVHVIMFTSNTGVEKALFEKQKDKLLLYDELKVGSSQRKIGKIDMQEILRIMAEEENKNLLMEINQLKV